MFLPKYAVGQMNHPGPIAVRLATDHYADTSSFEGVKNRIFNVYKWQKDLTLHDQPYSGFIPWLHYSKKWERYKPVSFQSIPEKSINGKPMLPMHVFFADLDEFKSWLGDEGFGDLLVDLL